MLQWKSSFLGFSDKAKQSIDRFTFRVYKQNKAQATVTIVLESYHENGTTTQTETYTIGDANNPYDSNGYALIDFLPSNKNAIASSIKITCAEKIVLVDGYATVTGAGESNVKNRR